MIPWGHGGSLIFDGSEGRKLCGENDRLQVRRRLACGATMGMAYREVQGRCSSGRKGDNGVFLLS